MTYRTTRWSLVQRAAGEASGGCDERHAMQELCLLYWPAVYRFFHRAANGDSHRAEDLTQGLFARFLSDRSLAQANPERGRFRTWLLACAQNHLRNDQAAAGAKKRGGDRQLLPLDFASEEGRLQGEPADPSEGPEQAFARRWVAALVERVLGQLAEEFEQRGRGIVFAAARAFLDPACDPGPMRAAAEEARVSEGAFKVAVHRARERFHERLRAEIEDTLDRTPERAGGGRADFEDELTHLLSLLSKP
ncbi:MAG: RNA polymerase sigma factor [Planctomycetota bacterium]